MITKLATPGVYVDEVPMLPPSVAEVESAIPAFVGYTKNDTSQGVSIKNIPKKITSWQDFEMVFGGGPDEDETKAVVTKTMEMVGGVSQLKISIAIDPTVGTNILWYAMKHFFDNGGGTCYVVSVGTYKAPDKAELKKGIQILADFDEPTMLLCPEASKLPVAESYELMQEMIAQAVLLKDRLALVDVYDSKPDGVTQSIRISDDIVNLRGGVDSFGTNITTGLTVPTEGGRYAAAYYPNLETTYQFNFDFDAILVDGAALSTIKGSILYNTVKTEFNKHHIILPPSAAMAGVITNTDNTRGYWKAPANVSVRNAVPTIILSDRQQDNLNIDPLAGKSVNVIRQFPGYGTLVWGARTLEGNNNEWRYVNVRRFFMVVEESIKKSINWAVFEPNTAQTWVLVQSMIENYLFLKWRDGALAGTKPEDAFFVRVGINKTMTPQDILEGKMIVEIGMAVARPAEFIVLKFMQLMQKS
jgi:uncharacterized protein